MLDTLWHKIANKAECLKANGKVNRCKALKKRINKRKINKNHQSAQQLIYNSVIHTSDDRCHTVAQRKSRAIRHKANKEAIESHTGENKAPHLLFRPLHIVCHHFCKEAHKHIDNSPHRCHIRNYRALHIRHARDIYYLENSANNSKKYDLNFNAAFD